MQYSFKKALKLYPGQAEVSVGKEFTQLHSRNAFAPQDATKLMPRQKKMALKSIMTVKDKRDESLKGRFYVDGQK